MENVVPWVPYLDATNVDVLGPAVTAYEYDQFSGEAAFSRVALDPSQQKGNAEVVDLKAQIDAYRELATSLGFEREPTVRAL